MKIIYFLLTLIMLSANLYSTNGITGYTKKTNATGCAACHSTHGSLNTAVMVQISGPATLLPGQRAQYTLSIRGGPGTKVACDIASSSNTLSIVDNNLKLSGTELVQNGTKTFSGGSYTFNFYYTAPSTPGTHTIYATGLSNKTNWNFAENFIVQVQNSPKQPIIAPDNLLAKQIDSVNFKVELKWKDNSTNETNFIVQRKEEPSGNFIQLASLNANTISFLDSGNLEAKKNYTYRVYAVNSDTVSDYSNTATVQIVRKIMPVLPPSDLQSVQTDSINYKVKLTWHDNSDNELNFIIERKEEPSGNFTQLALLPANSTQHEDNQNLISGKSYTYRIYASNLDTTSGFSNLATITIVKKILPVIAPTNLTAVLIDSAFPKVRLNWIDNSNNETGFVIERKEEPSGSFLNIATISANITSYLDSAGLSMLKGYSYRVYAVNADTLSDMSNTVTVNIPFTYVNENFLPAKFGLSQNYPNPFNPSTIIRYSIPGNDIVTVKIFDISGRLIETLVDKKQEKGEYQIQWRAEGVSSGIYLCELRYGNQTEIMKMVLNK